MMPAVSVATVLAPRREIDTLAFLSATELLMPSPTLRFASPWGKTDFSAFFLQLGDKFGFMFGQGFGEIMVDPQFLG